MRYSKLFGHKTLREAPQDAEAVSHRLLVRGQFIDKLAAGIYSFLPLGNRVHKKIENIIREEMNAIGGQEVTLPTLQPKEIWQKTDRWETMDPPLFKFKDRHDKELTIGPTHEEVITQLVVERVQSYKDLPLYLYQIQTKFRNEMRSTGGLLRVREFSMKDLYSFHTDEKDLESYYEKMRLAYLKIFARCGVEVRMVEAVSGSIGGAVNHEFMLFCPTGEDTIFYCQKCDWAANAEKVKEAGKCPKCDGSVEEAKAIENGHIFNLGTKYSEALGAYFTDESGQKRPVVMGCYGIGIGRLMASIVEIHHDEKGIVWPKEVAPYGVHLINLKSQNSKVKTTSQNSKLSADSIYEELLNANMEILYDDREEVSAGEKFADADLIGCPVRLVVSEKTLKEDSVEIRPRTLEETKLVKLGDLLPQLKTVFNL